MTDEENVAAQTAKMQDKAAEAKAAIEAAEHHAEHNERRSKWLKGLNPPKPIGVLSKPIPERKHLLELGTGPFDQEAVGWIPEGVCSLIAAPGGTGKTTMLMQLACALTLGNGATVFPKPSMWSKANLTARGSGGRVLVVLGEEELTQAKRTVQAWLEAQRGVGENAQLESRARAAHISERLHVIACVGHDSRLYSEVQFSREIVVNGEPGTTREARTMPTKFGTAIRKALQADGEPWRAVILDPLVKFAGWKSENDNAEANRAMDACSALAATKHAPAVIVAHHSAKGSSGARGASAIVDAARWVATLDRCAPPEEKKQQPDVDEVHRYGQVRRLATSKANYAETGNVINITWREGVFVPCEAPKPKSGTADGVDDPSDPTGDAKTSTKTAKTSYDPKAAEVGL